MGRRWVTNPEPLTLLTQRSLVRVYDREEILRQRATGNLPRTRVDQYIAKVLPADSVLAVEDTGEPDVVRVVDCEYRPYFTKDLFALSRLVAPASWPPPFPPRDAPDPRDVLGRLESLTGTPYLFGGSAPSGSARQGEELLRLGLFLQEDRDDSDLHQLMVSSGIDCSGLLNHTTDYYFFGDSVDVYRRFQEGLMSFPDETANDPEALAVALRPLDLIVFRRHVIIVLENARVIQAVGDGLNAVTFSQETGHRSDPLEKYNRVVIDDAVPILRALLHRQGRRFSPTWRFDEAHLMVVRWAE
jgi:cell wall-associated NlpC family hydrolase